MEAAGKLAIRDFNMPEIGEEEVLIKVRVCGTCHSEYYGWESGSEIGKRFGHEAVGIAERVGSRVNGIRPGERVTGVLWEAFAEYVKADWRDLTVIPDGISDVQAILEPWACLMSGAERVPLAIGDRVAIVGAGFMGLGFLQLMLLKGASDIIVIDHRPEALKNARRFGATETYLPNQIPENYFLTEWNDDIFDRGIPIVGEVTGNAEALELAGNLVGVHGTLAIAGYHHTGGKRPIDMNLWNWKAFTAINAHERRYSYDIKYMRAMLRMIQAGRMDTGDFITNKYSFDEINQAFRDMEEKPDGYIKGYVEIS